MLRFTHLKYFFEWYGFYLQEYKQELQESVTEYT